MLIKKLNDKQIIEKLEQDERFSDIVFEKKRVLAFDQKQDREVCFNLMKEIQPIKLIEFNSTQANKESFCTIFNVLPKNFFLTVRKIVFINNVAEAELFLKQEGLQDGYDFFDLYENMGKHLFFESIIIVNIDRIRQLAVQQNMDAYDFNYNVWLTLLHELGHNICANPLYSIETTSEEDFVENFARGWFESAINVPFDDFSCFNYL